VAAGGCKAKRRIIADMPSARLNDPEATD